MRRMVLLALAVSLAAVPDARADGMLDQSFGNGGLVTTNFPVFNFFDSASSLVVLPDGRAVAAGTTQASVIVMAVARYLPSGALDTSFSGDGLVTLGCPGVPGAGAEAVLLQPDGRLVLFGSCPTQAAFQFRLARLNEDGSLDSSFGTAGQVFTPFPGGGFAHAGVLQPDGRIVAAGFNGPAQTPTIAAARYNADGSLDSTFGMAGQLILPLAQPFFARDAALQPDGKLLIAGNYGSTAGPLDFGVVRLLTNGAPDPSFDGDGLATANFGGTEQAHTVVVLPDGRLVLGGSHNADFALVRFLPDGSVDSTFGTAGLASASFGVPVTPGEAIRLPNGKLLIAGTTNVVGTQDFLLARFEPDGVLDTSFGMAGFLRTDFGGTEDICRAVALAGPDLILTAGITTPAFDFALARYIATTPVELLTFQIE